MALFFYLFLFSPIGVCVCSSRAGSSTTLDGPVFGPPPGLLDVQSAREVVCSCDRGAVIMLDRDMAVLHRTWPLFEVGSDICTETRECRRSCDRAALILLRHQGSHRRRSAHAQQGCRRCCGDVSATGGQAQQDGCRCCNDVSATDGSKHSKAATDV
eukprot:scaffold108968_cov17-Tisochrysis_lutea.AAC.1